jgi:hypothetical protein
VFFWIPAFAGMTSFAVINVAAYKKLRDIHLLNSMGWEHASPPAL